MKLLKEKRKVKRKKNELIDKRAPGIIRKCKKSVILVKQILIKNFQMQKFCKVRDPCHYTGEYRSPTYSICNLKYSAPKKNYIVFHNGSNYDNHFITNELAEELLKKHNLYSSNRNRNYNLLIAQDL